MLKTIITQPGKLYMLSDLHFGVRSNSIQWKDMMVEYFDWFIDNCGSNPNEDILFVLGDVFDSRISVNFMILKTVTEVFQKLSEKFREIYIIAGNHDCYYIDNNSITAIEILSTIKNVNCITSPEHIVFNNKKMLMFPWEHDYELCSNIIGEDDSDYMFCHMDINDFKYPGGQPVKNKLNREAIAKYKKVYSGHIHTRQSDKNITYIGSPYQMDMGDIHDIKGYYYLDEDMTEHFVQNTVSPFFERITIKDILDSTVEDIKSRICNAYVRVICDKKSYLSLNLLQFREKLESLGIGFKKMEFYQEQDLGPDSDSTNEGFGCVEFNIQEEAAKMLRSMGKSESEIEARLLYFNTIYNKTLKDGEEAEETGK